MNGVIGVIEKVNGAFILETIGGYWFNLDEVKVQDLPLSDSDIGHIAILEAWNLKVTTHEDPGTDEELEEKIQYIRQRLDQGLTVA